MYESLKILSKATIIDIYVLIKINNTYCIIIYLQFIALTKNMEMDFIITKTTQ